MKFVSVRDVRSSTDLWRSLEEEREMVVTDDGHPIAILAAVNEATFEDAIAAFRRARAIAAVAAIQRDSAARGADAVTQDEVDAEIAIVRNARRH